MVLFYSTYGHVEKLAQEMTTTINQLENVTAELWRVPETLSEEVLTKMGAPQKDETIPVLTYDKLEILKDYDGFLFGCPTRFGMMSSQMKTFWDSTGGLWQTGDLMSKPAGLFWSTGTQGGGQETTPLTFVTQLSHHGMVFVPTGYSFGKDMFNMEEIRGGNAYGTGTYAGDGSRQPSDIEMRMAQHQAKFFANFVQRLN